MSRTDPALPPGRNRKRSGRFPLIQARISPMPAGHWLRNPAMALGAGLCRIVLLALALLVFPSGAEAHRLKVFATVEAGAITGYAFFVGGGRPHGAPWEISDAAGKVLASGQTDASGGFAWTPPGAAAYTVSVNVQDGHIASARLGPERFALAAGPGAPAMPGAGGAGTGAAGPIAADVGQAGAGPAGAEQGAGSPPGGPDQAAALTEARIEAAVRLAVQHEIQPLLERLEQMDSRLRLTDVLSGIFLIFGAAGCLVWLRQRRRGE